MISLKRIRTKTAVKSKYRGAKKLDKDKELMIAQRTFLNDPTEKVEFKSTFWKLSKTQLKKESNGKCAYCEANTQIVAHGDVEHFRPKSVYWWLAYTYDNYLYSCQICNQIYKSNHFPIGTSRFPEPPISKNTSNNKINQLAGNISPDPIDTNINYTLQQYIDEHKLENAFLINPYFEDPDVYFAYEEDDIINEMKIIPTESKFTKHIESAEEFYGINRIELKNERYLVFKKFRTFKKILKLLPNSSEKDDVKSRINEMLSSDHIFAGMNRFFDNKL